MLLHSCYGCLTCCAPVSSGLFPPSLPSMFLWEEVSDGGLAFCAPGSKSDDSPGTGCAAGELADLSTEETFGSFPWSKASVGPHFLPIGCILDPGHSCGHWFSPLCHLIVNVWFLTPHVTHVPTGSQRRMGHHGGGYPGSAFLCDFLGATQLYVFITRMCLWLSLFVPLFCFIYYFDVLRDGA